MSEKDNVKDVNKIFKELEEILWRVAGRDEEKYEHLEKLLLRLLEEKERKKRMIPL